MITSIRTIAGEYYFPLTIGLHQGSTLRSYIFALVIDDLTKQIQYEISWCMFSVDDIVLLDVARSRIN